jgi:hypothetical protein
MPYLIRTIEIISYRGSGESLKFIYSLNKEYDDGVGSVQRKYITRQQVDDHLNTGNWHKITASHIKAPVEVKMAIQIVEHNHPFLFKGFEEKNTLNTGEDEFSGII